MGALPFVLDGLGLGPESVGKASPPLDTIPDDVSDVSESTGPQTPVQLHHHVFSDPVTK